MFIEDFIKAKKVGPATIAGDPLDVEYIISTKEGHEKCFVRHNKAGVVFIGLEAECILYVRQQRVKQAIRTAERGMNPFITR